MWGVSISKFLHRGHVAAWLQIKCWSTLPCGSVAAWRQPLKTTNNPFIYQVFMFIIIFTDPYKKIRKYILRQCDPAAMIEVVDNFIYGHAAKRQ